MSEKVEMTQQTVGAMPSEAAEMAAQTADTQSAETVEALKAELAKLQAGLKQANQEAASRRKRLEELEAAEAKRKQESMTELERITQERDALLSKVKQAERLEMARKAAREAGIPESLAERLQGDDAESLLNDAKELAKTLPKISIPPTNVGVQEPRMTEAEQRARVYGVPSILYDPETQKKLGGGVYFVDKSSKE